MIALTVAVGALVTIIEPGTTMPLCTRVTAIAEGPGGVQMVWGVQRDSSRGVRAPLAEVRAGCPPASAAITSPTTPGVSRPRDLPAAAAGPASAAR
jgi:hypothetical protein